MKSLVLRVRATLLLSALLGSTFLVRCQRDVLQLDPVQRMAYAVKPAVVRVSAYATAQFRYPATAILEIERELRLQGFDVTAKKARALESIETGAGGSGSGFIIHPSGYILTSGHVIAPTNDRARLQEELLRNGAISALLEHFPLETLRGRYRSNTLDPLIDRLARRGSLADLRTFNEVELSNGEEVPFIREQYSPSLAQNGRDLALLKINRTELPALQLGDSGAVHLQEQIWVIGYPAVASSTDEVIGGWLSRDSDLEATINPGTITAIKRNVLKIPVFQTDVGIYQGNSGGPAVNRDGKVVGIATWGHTDAEQIKFLVPINEAREFLRSQVPVNVEGRFNVVYRRALDLAHKGDWIGAKKSLSEANALFPNSPDLVRFMRDAEVSAQTLPFWRIHPITTWTGVGLLLAGSAGAMMVLLRRRPGVPINIPISRETYVAPAPRSGTFPGAAKPSSNGLLGKFTILNGERAGERLGLGGSGIRIGRESSICEIVLHDPKVSRLHAEVVSMDGKVLLIDRNSSNGTYVNDQKIDRRFLRDGDIIYFGGRNAVAVAFHS